MARRNENPLLIRPEPPIPLAIIDGSSYLHRAFHALPPLINRQGEPTGAIFGVANMVRKLVKDWQPQRLLVVFDAPGPTFRTHLYQSYKANRPPTPRELSSQFDRLRELLDAMGIPSTQIEGVEADDVIATLVKQARSSGIPSLISSGDKDLTQLVNDDVIQLDTMSNTWYDPSYVEEKFGVPPALMGDYLTLVGDKTDNIPGIEGVGPKTATKWLQKYGGLDNLLAHADEIRGKVGEHLRQQGPQTEWIRQLVKLADDVSLPFELDELHIQPVCKERLRNLLQDLEFRQWQRELETAFSEAGAQEIEGEYALITQTRDWFQWKARIEEASGFAFDTESDGLDPVTSKMVGFSLAVNDVPAAYIPIAHVSETQDQKVNIDVDVVLRDLQSVLENDQHNLIGQNIKFDREVLAHCGIDLHCTLHDTMLESYVLDSTAGRHDLASIVHRELGCMMQSYKEVTHGGKIPFAHLPLDEAARYAAADAEMTLKAHRAMWPRLKAQPGLRRVYEQIEIPLIPVLGTMERHGVLVDKDMLLAYSEDLSIQMQHLERQVYELAGETFNLASPKQMQEVLFERLKLPYRRKTPGGQPSTGEDVLKELSHTYPIASLILEHRGLGKLRSTYAERLPRQIHPQTGRIHTSYHQAVTATGRLSSSDPNLQNIPAKTAEGRRIRQAFIAPPGYILLSADYSQIELRILAHFSEDEQLREAFAQGMDVHKATAAEIFSIAESEVSPAQRRIAKTINFGLIYGMSPFGLSRQLGIERSLAEHYVQRYFERYPRVRVFMEQMRQQARDAGYVETICGRRLYIREVHSPRAQSRQYAERSAINAPMQGTAADIIKLAMIEIHQWLASEQPDVAMMMQVHDELVFEVPENAIERVEAGVKARMEQALRLQVPLIVDTGKGRHWAEAH